MKYTKAIFENEDVKTLVVENEDLIHTATKCLIDYNITLETIIYSSLNSFIVEGDLSETYSNIVSKVTTENVDLINIYSDILRSNHSNEDKLRLTYEALDEVKNILWESCKNVCLGGGNGPVVFKAAEAGILGTDAKKWADDASSQIMAGDGKSTEKKASELTSARANTDEGGNVVKSKTGDSLATNKSTHNKMHNNLPKNGDPAKS